MFANAIMLLCLSRFGSNCETITQLPYESMERCVEAMEWILDNNTDIKQIDCVRNEDEETDEDDAIGIFL